MIKVAVDSVDPVDRRVLVNKAVASAVVGTKVATTVAASEGGAPAAPKPKAAPKAPKAKESIAPAAAKTGSTLGDLIKQKLGDQLEVKK
jgi:hypothetical protein